LSKYFKNSALQCFSFGLDEKLEDMMDGMKKSVKSNLNTNSFVKRILLLVAGFIVRFLVPVKQIIQYLPLHKVFRTSIISLLIIVFFSFNSNGATYYWRTAAGNGVWSSTTAWSTVGAGGASAGTYPGPTDDVVISRNGNLTVTLDGTYTCNSLTISYTGNTGGTIVLSIPAATNLVVTTGISYTNAGNGGENASIDVSGGALSCSDMNMQNTSGGTRDCYLLISDANSIVSVSGSIIMNGANNENYVLFTANGILNIGGTITGGALTSTAGGGATAPTSGTVNYNNAGAQTVGSYAYYNLTISGSDAKTTTGATVNNRLSLEGTATAAGTAPAYGAAASLRYMGSAAQTTGIEFTTPWAGTGGVLIENANGVTLNAVKTINAISSLTIGGTVNNSVFNDGGYQLTCTGTLNLTSGTFRLGAAGTATTWPAFGTRNIAAGTTVEYAAGVAQNISATPAYRNLTFSGAGTKTIAAGSTLSVAENWAVGSATTLTTTANATIGGNITGTGAITMGSGTVTVAGDFSNSGTFTCGTGTVNYNGTTQQVKGTTYNNLTISNGGTKTLQAATGVGGTLTLTSGVLQIADNNLTITNNGAGAIAGTFGSATMIATDGSGYLIKNGATAQTIYPIGSGGYYSPATLTITAGGTGGTVNVRAVPTSSLGSGILPKYWDVYTSIGGKTMTAVFSYTSSEGGNAKSAWFNSSGTWQTPPPTGTVTLGTYSATITGTTSITTSSTLWTIGVPKIYYSYQSGNWSNATTWTTDPSGTTLVGSAVPGNGDAFVILSGRTVTLTSNENSTDLSISINSGGILDLSTYQYTSAIASLSGEGTLRLASAYFPAVTSNLFVNAGGGTTEYYNAASFTLPVAQTTFNNLRINAPGVMATQLNNIILNGNLHVKQGTYRINDNTSARRQLTINGDVTVDNGASVTVGTGTTNTTADPTGIVGGTAPFINYYDAQSHRVVIYGDFTNNGTVRFTNQNYPVYSLFPNNGFATVYFMGATDNTLTCNGTTDFYNLVLDKGIDQTYKLTVYSSAYQNFRLFGANISSGDTPGANPNLKKALWIRTGTLVLRGLTIIPSLSEGSDWAGNPNSDFFIPSNGALVLDGPDVVVLGTADNYREINVAYGVTCPNNGAAGINPPGGACISAISILGKLQVDDGFLSTKESGGFITWNLASGQFVINGGIVDAKQFRPDNTGTGLASFEQNGGTFILRGRFQRTPTAYASISNLTDVSLATLNTARTGMGLYIDPNYGTFNINNAANVFIMSGGTIRIYDVCGIGAGQQKAFDVLSSTANINVTGGTVELIPTTGTNEADAANFFIASNASFGNLTINRASSTTDVALNTYHLNVLGNLNLTSGTLVSNDLNVNVGGNFTVANGTTYTPGTNWTIFNGSGSQNFTVNTTAALSLKKFKLNKPAGTILTLTGSQSTINVSDSVIIMDGTLADGGKTINFTTSATTTTSYLYNSGVHTGTGRIVLADDDPQVIDGDGTGIFGNLELNNNDAVAAPVSLNADITINGALTFSQDKLFNINTRNLILASSASIVNGGANRYIQTNGGAGDGGVTIFYPSAAAVTFPVGATSSSHAAPNYTPATIGFNGTPTVLGSITIVPVGYEHPATTNNGRSLTYFWRVKSSGFTLGVATVTHSYTYSQNDVVTGGDVTENGYIAARYNAPAYSWTKGTANDVDDAANNIIGEPGTGSFLENVTFIDGDYTAGDDNATDPFGAPTRYYSRQSGAWSNVNTWSTVSHTGPSAAATPGINDVVIIGDNDSIYLFNEVPPLPVNDNNPAATYYQRNKVVVSCASLQIETGSVLDIQNNPGSNFGFVLSHPNGNGKIRITTRNANFDTPEFFVFPSGDFSDFNVNSGISEFYTINPQVNTYYILPSNASSYGTVILTPLRGSNLILPNIPAVTIYGDLICNGSDADAWLAMTWGGIYGAIVPKTVSVKGNLNVVGGSFGFISNTNILQKIIIDGDVYVAPAAGIDMWANSTNNSMFIGGNLINNSDNTIAPYGSPSIVRFRNGGSRCDVTFFGSTNASITNTAGNPTTTFNNVTVNKGTSQATTLTCDIGGALNTLTNNWLTLQNGTFRYERTGDFSITTTSTFTIPGTAGLYINTPSDINIANSNVNTNDLYLNGKLTIINGRVFVGTEAGTDNNDNDIEYSGGGLSEIEIQGGSLIVNGQIRRNPATTNGILDYTQSGGNLIINGNGTGAALTTNAKLEILNGGSSFNMSGGAMTIVRGGGGNTYGDLYLRPETSSVTGGTIIFTQSPTVGPVVDAVQNYQLDANVPLNNLTIDGKTTGTPRNATVRLMINPLVLNGDLTITNASSIFDANNTYNIPVTIKGNMTYNGTYNYYQNLTTFSGIAQSINRTIAGNTNFYNLNVNSQDSLVLSRDVIVNNDLTISTGRLICGANTVNVYGDIVNNGTYTDNNTGVRLNGTALQHISGTGTFGRLELNNSAGARVDSDITLQRNLVLTSGIFDINTNLLTLETNSSVIANGTPFSSIKMITSDGVYSDVGIRKWFNTGASAFTFPLGCVNKYTPAVLTVTANSNSGYVRLNNINNNHPGVFDPANVLDYFWEVESYAINGFSGNLVLNYLQGDVQGALESDYIAARLVTPGTNWSKAFPGPATDNVDEINNQINFTFSGINDLSGHYTAGVDTVIPNNVPTYTSNNNGNWTDNTIWTQTAGDPYPCPAGGPNGFKVIIDHLVTANADNCLAYNTTINNELRIVSPYVNHNLGTVDGNGTLYLEGEVFPAGRFDSFLDCANNGTLEYGGTTDYNIIADLYSTVPNLLFTGTGTRTLPNKNLTICNQLLINGPVLSNSANNRKLTIMGTMVRTAGSFLSGTTDSATVVFAGTSAQTISGFSGANAFNNLEINNANGLTLTSAIDVKNKLLLTNGLINTTATNILSIINTSVNCVTPAAGDATSYIAGPLTKRLNQGDTYFQFPVGNASALGNKLSLRATQTGTLDWTVEYINPSALNTLATPLTAVNEREYWNVTTPTGGQAIVNIKWDAASDLTPLMTQNGVSDMRISEHNGADWTELASSATGDNYTGSAETSSRVTIPAGGSHNYTLACINTPKPRIRLSPPDPVCGDEGIPVTLSVPYTIYSPFTVNYSIDGVEQTALNPASFPFTLPTGTDGGVYQLTGFTYNYPAGNSQTGVWDINPVTTYTRPDTARAGNDASFCGATSTFLAANAPTFPSTGLWSIVSGAGGTVVSGGSPTSNFLGTLGTTYTLRWTITNGLCTSYDDVVIAFPVLAAQPGAFTVSSANVCQGQTGVTYTVPNDASVTYTWNYTGTGATINGTGNSVTVDFNATSTSGNISVNATNSCGTSADRTMAITVNPLPTITLGTFPEVCEGITPANLTYSAVANSPNQYSIDFDAAAEVVGFADVTNAALPASPIAVTVPVAASPATYNANLRVRNTGTMCISIIYPITITVNQVPATGPVYRQPNN
jgi:hypothetical protein